MKKYLFILASILILLTSCAQDSIEPPDLKISSENNTITAATGTFGWSENSNHVEADSDTPPNIVEFQEGSLVVSQEEILNLIFKITPNDVQINIWKDDNILEQELEDNKIIVPNEVGNLVYEVVVGYEQGTVHYAFEVVIEN
jgi:hypothetical protein